MEGCEMKRDFNNLVQAVGNGWRHDGVWIGSEYDEGWLQTRLEGETIWTPHYGGYDQVAVAISLMCNVGKWVGLVELAPTSSIHEVSGSLSAYKKRLGVPGQAFQMEDGFYRFAPNGQ
jgi:hypothetical protein